MLVEEINLNLRTADYKLNPNYGSAWNFAGKDPSQSHKEENHWIYRGKFPTKEKSTATRGSLNIEIDEQAIKELDGLIESGVVDANYKIGEPGTPSEPSSRHDAVTLYFLTEPSPEALQALSKIAEKHLRGNDLIGKKIAEGFYLSEVGSISDHQAESLLQQLQGQDAELEKAMRSFLTSINTTTGKPRVAMSEAQFYAVKETLDAFGLKISYDKTKGISIS